MIKRLRCACALALTLASAFASSTTAQTPASSSAVHYFEGKAYHPSGSQLMYVEAHWVADKHTHPSRLVLYRCPDGKPFARKRIQETGSPQAPDFVLNDGRTGYQEGVRSEGDKRIVFVRKKRSAAEKTTPLDTSPMPVVDGGFDDYIRAHWDELGTNISKTIPFVIPSRLDTLKFNVKREADTTVEGRNARHYRLSLDSWIGFALPHIDVDYDASTRELLRFDGMANIHASDGDNIEARIVFDPDTDKNVSKADMAAAEKAPLDGECHIP